MDDLATLLDPTLRLPIGGKQYVVPAPTARVGLRLEALLAVAVATNAGTELPDRFKDALQVDEPVDLVKDALGPAYDEMVDDGLSLPLIRHAGQTAFRHWTSGPAAGAAYWAAAGAAADAEGKGSTSTSTAEATSTPPQASTSGTTSHRTSSPTATGRA